MSEEQPQAWLAIRLPIEDDDAMLQVALIRTRARDAYRWTVARRVTNNGHGLQLGFLSKVGVFTAACAGY